MGTAVLVGVFSILGFVVAGFGQYLIERRREDRHTARELIVAARVVMGDLRICGSALDYARDEGTWWFDDLPVDSWSDYRSVLTAMPAKDWVRVEQAYTALASAERTRLNKRVFDGLVRSNIELWLLAVQLAIRTLAEVAKVPVSVASLAQEPPRTDT